MFCDPTNSKNMLRKMHISDFAKVLTGATPKKDIVEYYIDEVPWVKTGEIANGYIYDTEEYISKRAVRETNCKILPINSVLVAMYGQGKTRGQSGLLKISAATNQACAAILPNENYNSLFLLKQMNLQYEQLRIMGRGGNQANLNLDMIKNFIVLMPGIALQNEFADFVQQVDKLKVVGIVCKSANKK